MKKYIIILIAICCCLAASSQGIYNDGARIVNDGNGSYWVVDDGDFTLTSASATNLAQIDNLTIMGDASLTLTATSFLSVTGTLANNSGNDGLVLDASTTSSASLKQSSASVSATVKREIAAWNTNHGWHFLSSPVASQAISTEFVDVTANPMSASVDFYRWSEPLDLWVNIKNGNTYNQGSGEANFSNDASPVFAPGKGYLIAYQSTVKKSFTGTLNNASVSVTGLSKTDGTVYSGWNLIGNPFPSAIQWGLGTWNLSNVDAVCQIWNEANASYTSIVSNGNNIIPSMNGFMVHASVDNASLTIPLDARVHNTTNWYKNFKTEGQRILLKAVDHEGSTAQESIIAFDAAATEDYDTQYDSYFLAGYAPLFYSIGKNSRYALNTLPVPTQETNIPMGFEKNSGSDFTIILIETTIEQDIYLIDLKLGHTHLLSGGNYSFTSETGDAANRFLLKFNPMGSNQSEQPEINAWVFDQNLYVSHPEGPCQVDIIDLTGRVLQSFQLESGTYGPFRMVYPAGVYFIRLSAQISSKTIKVIKK